MEDDDRCLTFIEFITFDGSKEVERNIQLLTLIKNWQS